MPRPMEIFSRSILGTRATGSLAPACTNQKGAQNIKSDQTGYTNTDVATQLTHSSGTPLCICW